MHCAIYKGNRKFDHYLYVEKENDFSRVPDALLEMLGNLELVMTLDLTADRQLANADIEQVRRDLKQQGYFFQMPPKVYEAPLNS